MVKTIPGEMQEEFVIFADEQPRPNCVNDEDSWKIMIVDDEEAIHTVTITVLEHHSFDGKPFSYVHAYSGEEAIRKCHEHPDLALVILDVVMEHDAAGFDVVRYIRNELKNTITRIILYTGQPGQAPEYAVIRDYDINDYKVKSLLTSQGLHTSVISALRTYRDLHVIKQQRDALQEALEESQIAHKARYQFLANIGHELRTPLNHILGFSEMLLHTKLNERQQRYIETIKKSGEGLALVLKSILELTESIEGKITLQKYPFSLRAVMADLLQVVEVQAQWKNLTVTSHIDESVPDALYGDSKRLQQILMNLFGNAIKFTKQGSISIHISQTAAPCRLLFSVKDTGVGISREMQANILKPFGLGEDTLKKEFSGVGLGLAIAKDLLDKMHGRIWFESEFGQGSTFYCEIPFDLSEHFLPEYPEGLLE
ncbi:two-component sensor protein histidine kinase [Candidatus Moduliflexus flocculans]|uniref:histidine kinase n=1 Tax=Candidatus Moduliflexus flocculans TaxID=1499966 RepID=A0A081BQH6_9BACT|nr:two-component sensor protein histidine kinase [Candidatus Moduliflexus flocculans]